MRRTRPSRSSKSYDPYRSVEPPPPKSPLGSTLNYMTLAIIGGVFILGIGLGIAFSSSTTSMSPQNVASREFIDRSAPNPEMCVQYGASAVVADARIFLTFNPFGVYLSQPTMQPGCVIRRNNWAVLEKRGLIDSEDERQCRQRMNTFGYTGDANNEQDAKVDCIYQNDAAGNLFLKQQGPGAPPGTENF